jgi:hypothetical protein
MIEPAELSRIYPLTGKPNGTMKQSVPGEPAGASLAELLVERDRLVAEQAETIRDLRHRLDREAEERRQLIAILTDQRRRPWWRRWFR